MNQILVVEDEVVIRTALKRLLERHEYEVSEAGTVKESLEKYDMEDFDVIISDLRLPGAPGTDLIKASSTPVLIMTSYSSIRSAIDSMKMGAVDYIAKPFEHNEIIESVAKAIREHAKSTPNDKPAADEIEPPVHGMIGSCPQMMELFRRIRKVALTSSTVLINGESGTGKELVVRAIHNLSNRLDKEMISVNCAAIPENLIESELFGHDIDAVVQVFPKFSICNQPFEVAVGGCDQSYIHLCRLYGTDFTDFTFLQYSQQPGLGVQRQLTDFIQK